MIKLFYFSAILLFTTAINTSAQDKSFLKKNQKSPNVNHVGNVWLNEINVADSTFKYGTSIAISDAGSRLNWHIHPGGQILMVTDGEGFYQEKGKAKLIIRKGDVIKCAPGIAHWHGATPRKPVTYIATSPSEKGKTIWLKKVTDEEYFGVQ